MLIRSVVGGPPCEVCSNLLSVGFSGYEEDRLMPKC